MLCGHFMPSFVQAPRCGRSFVRWRRDVVRSGRDGLLDTCRMNVYFMMLEVLYSPTKTPAALALRLARACGLAPPCEI